MVVGISRPSDMQTVDAAMSPAKQEEPKEASVEPLALFLQSAATVIKPGQDSEVHVALRSRDYQALGKKIRSAAEEAGLFCSSVENFDLGEFMGYRVSYGSLPREFLPGHPNTSAGTCVLSVYSLSPIPPPPLLSFCPNTCSGACRTFGLGKFWV